MNKYAIGDNVTYIGCNKDQINWGSNTDPHNILIENQIYKVVDIEIHTSHTKLILEGINGKFNSVCFLKQ